MFSLYHVTFSSIGSCVNVWYFNVGMQSRSDSMNTLSMSLNEDQLLDQKEFEKMAKAQKNLIVSLPRQPKDPTDFISEGEMKKKKKKKNKNSWQPKGSSKKAKTE